MEEFETFWKTYPRKVGKADARKAWAQTERLRPDTDTLLQAVLAACKTEQWMQIGRAHV